MDPSSGGEALRSGGSLTALKKSAALLPSAMNGRSILISVIVASKVVTMTVVSHVRTKMLSAGNATILMAAISKIFAA